MNKIEEVVPVLFIALIGIVCLLGTWLILGKQYSFTRLVPAFVRSKRSRYYQPFPEWLGFILKWGTVPLWGWGALPIFLLKLFRSRANKPVQRIMVAVLIGILLLSFVVFVLTPFVSQLLIL